MILADANLWIFAIDAATPEHAAAKAWFHKARAGDELLVPAVVQAEVLHHASRFLAHPAPLVEAFLAQPGIQVPLDHGVLAEAWPILRKESPAIGARDAAILVHARRHSALLASDDLKLLRAGKRLGLRVTNPIARS